MKDIRIAEHIKHLQAFLDEEQQYDRQQYLAKLADESYAARRKEGICWYPVTISDCVYDGGERLRIMIERYKEHTVQHSFQSGKPVHVFANGQDDLAVTGVVNYVRGNEMAISLNVDDEPEWFRTGKIGIQLLFDENTYKQMHIALKEILATEHPRLKELVETILGEKAPRFAIDEPFSAPNLNQSQNSALQNVSSAQDVAIIHGPPGTGKTTTLVQSILQTLRHEHQVLVCAPSNTAADLLVEKLSNAGADVVRIGHAARVTEEVLEHTFDVKTAQHTYYKELRDTKKRAEELRSMAHKYKRSFGASERSQRRQLFSEARLLDKEAEQLSFYIASDILSKSQVIVSTLVGAANSILKGRRFGSVFIDEAAQALEPACWIPILKAERVIFAGDHLQLPPTVKSPKAAKGGLSVTLFERILETKPIGTLLREQYRMNSTIMEFSSNALYGGQLIAHSSVADWLVFSDDVAIEFVDTAGCGFEELQDSETKSYENKDEGQIVFEHLVEYCSLVPESALFESVGIIAPYRSQVAMLKALFADTEVAGKERITVNTIDSFQGQECDIMYISLTRSNDRSEVGFLSDIRRMNVAITRAKKKLVVVGDSATVGSHPFYDSFISYATEHGRYRSAYEFMWQG